MICPCCKSDLDGGSIWEHFFYEFTEGKGDWLDNGGQYTNHRINLTPSHAAVRADEAASLYGATRTEGRFGREIYCKDYQDGKKIRYYKCPDCGGEW